MRAQPASPRYAERGDTDFAYEVPGLASFRVNLFKKEQGMGAVFRIISTKMMTVEQLGMLYAVHRITKMRNGLVPVTGATGSGKSTTIAGIIHEMNMNRTMHFDPIIDAQDYALSNIDVTLDGDEVVARFTNGGEAREVRWVMEQEEGRWVTLDLRTARGWLATLIGGHRRIV